MKVVVGLGNPGEKYKNTRHSVGFLFVDVLAEKLANEAGTTVESLGGWNYEKKTDCAVFKLNGYLLAKPQTFMNNSGGAVAKLVEYFDVNLDDLTIIHDDVDFPVGEYRFKKGMGAGGHHGIEDIIQKLGSKEFYRLRIGIGRPQDNSFDVYEYVLSELEKEEVEGVKKLLDLV